MNPLPFDQCATYVLANAKGTPVERRISSPRAVTISRETGAGAVTVGQLVAEYLQSKHAGDPRCPWTVFDRNLVKKVLKDHKLPETLEAHMPEDAVHRLDDLLKDLLGVHPSAWTLAHHTRRTILRLALAGNAIIVGRGAHLVTANLDHVFHVRLIAPLEFRIQHTQDYYHLSRSEAVEFVRKGDRARSRYIRRHFKARIQNPLQYHITINTGRMAFSEAARLISEAVK